MVSEKRYGVTKMIKFLKAYYDAFIISLEIVSVILSIILGITGVLIIPFVMVLSRYWIIAACWILLVSLPLIIMVIKK